MVALMSLSEPVVIGGWQGFLREMTRNSRAPEVQPLVKAAMYAELGEKDKALESLNGMYEDRRAGLLWLKVDPRFDSLRTDPRFQDLQRRVGLAP